MCRTIIIDHLVCGHSDSEREKCTPQLLAERAYASYLSSSSGFLAQIFGIEEQYRPEKCRRPQAAGNYVHPTICEKCLHKYPCINADNFFAQRARPVMERLNTEWENERKKTEAEAERAEKQRIREGLEIVRRSPFGGGEGIAATTEGDKAMDGRYMMRMFGEPANDFTPDAAAIERLKSPERKMAGGFTPSSKHRAIFPSKTPEKKPEASPKKVSRPVFVSRFTEDLPEAPRPGPQTPIVPRRKPVAGEDYYHVPGAYFEDPSVTARRPPLPIRANSIKGKPLPMRIFDKNKPLPLTPHERQAVDKAYTGFKRPGSHCPPAINIPPNRPRIKCVEPTVSLPADKNPTVPEKIKPTISKPIPMSPLFMSLQRSITYDSGLKRSNTIASTSNAKRPSLKERLTSAFSRRAAAAAQKPVITVGAPWPLTQPRPRAQTEGFVSKPDPKVYVRRAVDGPSIPPKAWIHPQTRPEIQDRFKRENEACKRAYAEQKAAMRYTPTPPAGVGTRVQTMKGKDKPLSRAAPLTPIRMHGYSMSRDHFATDDFFDTTEQVFTPAIRAETRPTGPAEDYFSYSPLPSSAALPSTPQGYSVSNTPPNTAAARASAIFAELEAALASAEQEILSADALDALESRVNSALNFWLAPPSPLRPNHNADNSDGTAGSDESIKSDREEALKRLQGEVKEGRDLMEVPRWELGEEMEVLME